MDFCRGFSGEAGITMVLSVSDARQVPIEENKQVQDAVDWLLLNYAKPVSIGKLARALGYHRTHLSKMFKLQTGTSPMQFLLQIRMEQARLLLCTPLSIKQIAYSTGFSDPLYFSRQFKKSFGQPPSTYRRRYEELIN